VQAATSMAAEQVAGHSEEQFTIARVAKQATVTAVFNPKAR